MRPYITETLEQARCLLNVAVRSGQAEFRAALSAYLDSLVDALSGRPADLDRRLLAFSSGILAVFFEGQTERVIRHQLQLSESYAHEPDPRRRTRAFLEHVCGFVEAQVGATPERSLSGQLTVHLRMISARELRGASVASFAEAFGYHPDHFTKKVRTESGCLPSDLILDERLRRAFLLIKHRDHGRPLKEIAHSLGFNDYPHFRDLMKKRFGVSPSLL